ncbi:MAG TPA: hypothetical protein VL989_01780 [Candidatus Sulfotelmatobacter sp.]|nr:hypothetical protein [Candidatus Sulfotelmatobacter sp.]
MIKHWQQKIFLVLLLAVVFVVPLSVVGYRLSSSRIKAYASASVNVIFAKKPNTLEPKPKYFYSVTSQAGSSLTDTNF